jgi:hypothetical protein
VNQVPELPEYPTPQEKKVIPAPTGIPNIPHPKQAAPLQKMISKMFKGPKMVKQRSIVGHKSRGPKKKNQVNFY